MNKKYNKNCNAKYLDGRDGDIKESICDNNKILDTLKLERFKQFEEEIINL